MTVCEACSCDTFRCERHDAYFCPRCDVWLESACNDPACDYCPGRPARPSGCDHRYPHDIEPRPPASPGPG